MSDHLHVARAFDEIALLLALSGESPFKSRAYERGASIVLDLGEQLPTLLEEGRLTEVEGIGERLATQIAELTSTGTSAYLEQLRSQHPRGAVELARIPGLTIRRIRALHDGLGIDTVDELRQACLDERVRTLQGFGPKTEQNILKAIERASQPKEPARMLLVDAQPLAARIARALTGGPATEVFVAGAVRRGAETVAELELVVITDDEAAVWARAARMPWVTRVEQARGCARLAQGIELRLHCTQAARTALEIIEATGPTAHVEQLRARASTRGVALEQVATDTHEADVYRTLELPYPPPEVRGTPSDFDPRGYDDLIADADIRGMVHCHSTYSDGRNTIEEMARAAEALGMHYITITDHSPSAHYARGVALDRLKEQWDEIASVQERVKIKILRGTESDILADGLLDYPDDVLERFDVVIASIHGRHKMDRDQMTARLTRAMSLPIFKIWGHALGRILLSREPFACDVLKVLDALAGSRGAVELNGDPHRLDLPAEWIPEARARGIPFVISVDAHSTKGLSVFPLGVQLGRRGGLRRSEVLNALPAAELAERVRPIGS